MDMPCRGKLLFYSALFFYYYLQERIIDACVSICMTIFFRQIYRCCRIFGHISCRSCVYWFIFRSLPLYILSGKKKKKNNWVLERSGKEIEKEENRSSRILVSSQRAAHRHRIIGHWLHLLTHFHLKLICSKKILLPNFTHKNNFSGIKLANEWAVINLNAENEQQTQIY